MAKKPFGENNEKEEKPEWTKSIKKESVDNILKQPPIYPQLKPRLDAKYHLEILTLPRKIQTEEFGEGFVMDVLEGNMRQSLFVGESIKINLEVHVQRNNLDYDDLIGKTLTIQKVEKTIKGQKRKVFLVQFD